MRVAAGLNCYRFVRGAVKLERGEIEMRLRCTTSFAQNVGDKDKQNTDLSFRGHEIACYDDPLPVDIVKSLR